MDIPVTVLFFVEWNFGHDLLHHRPRSERPFIFRTCRAGSSERPSYLRHAVLLPKARAMATCLQIANAQGPRPRGVRAITGILPEAPRGENR